MATRLNPWDLSTYVQQQRRADILANPTETLKIECKSWLDLTDQHHKAKLAKEAIALANSGGGVIVFGIHEDDTQAKHFNCVGRPNAMNRYTTDAIDSAINQYAEPSLDFKLQFENHPETGNEHAFVEITGGMQQPVFAKKQFDGVIRKLACYIRKPGPKSEEPHTAQEWSELLQSCVLAKRDSLLDGIRTIIDGRPVDTTPTKSDGDMLREFMAASKARWQERLKEVDEDDVARLQHGYWTFAFSIVGAPPCPSLNDLRREMDQARPYHLRHFLFEESTRHGAEPYPFHNSVEAWTGNPIGNGYRMPYSCSFWRATLRREFYHLQGFIEDSGFGQAEPGTRLEHDKSIRLHAMMLSLAARIARTVGTEAEIVICSELTGLKARYLAGSQNWWTTPETGRRCTMDIVPLAPKRLSLQQIDETLVEVLYDFLFPLYYMFKFYELERGWVEAAVESVKKDGW